MTTAAWFGLLVSAAVTASAPPALAYFQERGPARLVVEGGEVQQGKVQVPLSGQLRLTITLEGGAGLKAEPVKTVTPAETWQVRGPGSLPEREALPGGGVRWRQQLLLEPLQPGESSLTVPPLRYRTSADAAAQTAVWAPVPVKVTTEVSAASLKELRDGPPPERPDVPPSPRLWPPLAALAAVVVALAVVFWVRRLRRPAPPAPLPPPAWALQELDRLEALDLPAQGEFNRYHTLLADTVRRYLELRFGVPAPQRTTAEFLEAVRATSHLGPEQETLLADLLERCDLAKFAGATPSAAQCREVAAAARSFVEQTAAPAARQPG
ncbi:MAG TPA: hypothetical protein VJ739_18290 [Gemmataceae bacterium]|nr:hypothetical protein [Gemmataceae bacterium]